jgi:hypothetical protein
MAKKSSNQGRPWTSKDVSELETLAKQNMPPGVIALTMGRTLEAVYRKAKQHGISLKSTDQSRYRTKRS